LLLVSLLIGLHIVEGL
jgi:hypothetical protein